MVDEAIHPLRRSSTPRPPWLKTVKSSFAIPEPADGFSPADLVLPIPAPPEDGPVEQSQTESADTTMARESDFDISRYTHLHHPQRFDRHLRRLHELIGTSRIITLGEMLKQKKRRGRGQIYIENVYGLYEVEDWGTEESRRAQLMWTQWLVDAVSADRGGMKLSICPEVARDVLRVAFKNMLRQAEDGKKKEFSQRMFEGTRLEAGIVQADVLMLLARCPCIMGGTAIGTNILFEEKQTKVEDLPDITDNEVLDRFGSFLIVGRLGRTWTDAKVIVTSNRKKNPMWSTLRQRSEMQLRTMPQPHLQGANELNHAPAQPSGLRNSMLAPASTSSTHNRHLRKSIKARPYCIGDKLRAHFGADVDKAATQVKDRGPRALIKQLCKITGHTVTSLPAGAEISYMTTNPKKERAIPRGIKRSFETFGEDEGNAQEAVKRARTENERRRSSGPSPCTPPGGKAQQAIQQARTENQRRRSSSETVSRPPDQARRDVRPEGGQGSKTRGEIPGNGDLVPQQQVAPSEVHDSNTQSRIRAPGRVYQAPTHVQPERSMPTVSAPLQSEQEQPRLAHEGMTDATVEPVVQGHQRRQVLQQSVTSIQVRSQAHQLQQPDLYQQSQPHARTAGTPGIQQNAMPGSAPGGRAAFLRQQITVPDALQKFDAERAAHTGAVADEILAHQQLIRQILSINDRYKNETPERAQAILEDWMGYEYMESMNNLRGLFPEMPAVQFAGREQGVLVGHFHTLSLALEIMNPIRADARAQWGVYHRTCCHLEARVLQLNELRFWTLRWRERLGGTQRRAAKAVERDQANVGYPNLG